MPAIEFIDMRMNVLGNVQDLSNLEQQQKCWVRHEAYGCFDEVIHALYDDSGFASGTRASIGSLLYDAEEADNISAIMDLIDALFERYGRTLSDAEYISKPEWPTIVAAAKSSCDVMRRNDSRYLPPNERQGLYQKYNIPA